ncbi:uncharacterized protein LOC108704513 [Xenopus laevis]|uniref:ribonuclease H n=1 Tax=Xenopus laevis TaxID=8355 RepID=A0A8J0U4U0_XENLA|nr:uncharacterized protein LOC108704513 [Xenopus laevis]XP_041428583.1 uncharacterized protein LOC108704513 [Xenopus laevis]
MGLLFESFCDSQKGRIGSICTRPERAQQIHTSKKIQNGIFALHHCSNDPRTISSLSRHLPIFPLHQKYIRFAIQNHHYHYQFKALPFSLTSAPRVYTKIMAVTTAEVRQTGVSITLYLDDLLIKASSLVKAEGAIQLAMCKLKQFGWTINLKKSSLTPSQSMVFLGLLFYTQAQTVRLETRILKKKGFSDAVISSMRAAQKPTSARAYYRVWNSYKQLCLKNKVNFEVFSMTNLLEFLQEGESLGLSLCSLRSQISALSVLFQRRLVLLSDVKIFLQGVAHVVPPFCKPVATWDLSLVLKALQKAQFEPLATIPLQSVTWKTVSLIAFALAR